MAEKIHDVGSMNLSFMEELYENFLRDPESVPNDWREYFAALLGNGERGKLPQVKPVCDRKTFLKPDWRVASRCDLCGRNIDLAALQHQVDRMIRGFRAMGHRVAHLDPLGRPRAVVPELDPGYYGFGEADMELPFATTTLSAEGTIPLRQIVERLRNTYCRSIGVEFVHIDDLEVRDWLQERMERSENRLPLTRDEQIRILTKLTDAVIFEEFIQKKFTGAKRFSLEGAESLIPLLDLAIEKAGEYKINEVVIGMAHRGRLNVLANIMGKSPSRIFREFEDSDAERNVGRGDVKYHLGFHSDWHTTSGHLVHLALCFNPSHLEFVDPVAMGRARAKQDRLGDTNRERGMVLLIHGDAAFAGEGVVQESLNLSQLGAYTIGGSIHVVVNNQIGFTTPPEQGRSTGYATDVAKMLQSPIFHVNGEDPEAVAQVINLAMDFRKTFKRDVVIDMYCYRRHGHNESDEPAFTQPLMYAAIRERRSVRQGYLKHLLEFGEVTKEEADRIVEERRAVLEDELAIARGGLDTSARDWHRQVVTQSSILGRLWKQYKGGFDTTVPEVDTGAPRERLEQLLDRMSRVPDGFHPHPKVERLLEARRQMARGEVPLDWAAAEALAFATLAVDGARVRLTGQDSERGTFSHRHAVLHDIKDGRAHRIFEHLADEQAPVDIFNSPLSETGVLGFEYGYSFAYPDGLIMWEAQFGDFCNAAQVLIDQGITSAEDKWGSLTGLVMLLPHGFEGMGPEHSSARLERFLSLAAEDNIQVVVPSTPAQFFHCLRRQVMRPWRKPLIALTPKSLLRHPRVNSTLDDLATGRFQRILPDARGLEEGVRRVLMCSGKIYYDLEEERDRTGREDVAVLRVEQLYPLQENHIEKALTPYPEDVEVVWVQEEPENMGAWLHWRARFCNRLLGRWRFRGIYRAGSASPATGSASSHRLEQARLVQQAFDKAE